MKNTLGTKIEKTNGLSRRLDWKLDTENNNKNQILIKEQWIYNLAKEIRVETNIPDFAIEGVLSMKCKNEK